MHGQRDSIDLRVYVHFKCSKLRYRPAARKQRAQFIATTYSSYLSKPAHIPHSRAVFVFLASSEVPSSSSATGLTSVTRCSSRLVHSLRAATALATAAANKASLSTDAAAAPKSPKADISRRMRRVDALPDTRNETIKRRTPGTPSFAMVLLHKARSEAGGVAVAATAQKLNKMR